METQNEQLKPKKKEPAMVTLAPELKSRVAQLAADRQWSLAQAGGWLISLGFEKLDEQREASPNQMTATA